MQNNDNKNKNSLFPFINIRQKTTTLINCLEAISTKELKEAKDKLKKYTITQNITHLNKQKPKKSDKNRKKACKHQQFACLKAVETKASIHQKLILRLCTALPNDFATISPIAFAISS